MNKYLSPWGYIRKLRKLYYSCFDATSLLEDQVSKFAAFGIDYHAASDRLASLGIEYDENHRMCSQHWLFFAGLRPMRILEIGTYDARFTRVLSLICPNAEIITCDLPDDSPCFNSTYKRDIDKDKFIARRSANLSGLNVTFIQANSFLLPGMDLGKFDAIWVDGGHDYPDVAWDACNAYHMVDNGFILFDDVYRHPRVNKYLAPDCNDSVSLTDLLQREGLAHVEFIFKRLTPDPVLRKHIAVIRRRSNICT